MPMIRSTSRLGTFGLTRQYGHARLLAVLLVVAQLACHGVLGAMHQPGMGSEAQGHFAHATLMDGVGEERSAGTISDTANHVAALLFGLTLALWLLSQRSFAFQAVAPPGRRPARRAVVCFRLPRGPTPASLGVLRL